MNLIVLPLQFTFSSSKGRLNVNRQYGGRHNKCITALSVMTLEILMRRVASLNSWNEVGFSLSRTVIKYRHSKICLVKKNLQSNNKNPDTLGV